jgi:L-alanine-DL-glutamate epimerase-like enolase superfamily enzyme
MRALRDALGESVDIMIDCHGRHFPANAIEFCRVLAPIGPTSSKSRSRRRT